MNRLSRARIARVKVHERLRQQAEAAAQRNVFYEWSKRDANREASEMVAKGLYPTHKEALRAWKAEHTEFPHNWKLEDE